jgi:hypothetical protein
MVFFHTLKFINAYNRLRLRSSDLKYYELCCEGYFGRLLWFRFLKGKLFISYVYVYVDENYVGIYGRSINIK